MQEDTLELGGERGAQEVYEEFLCDWPLISPDDVRTLTEALPPNTERAPEWFRINARFLKGIEYFCNSGFTRSSALSEEGTAKLPGTSACMVVVGVLSQIDRLLATNPQQAIAELQGPEQLQYAEEPVFSLGTSADSLSADALLHQDLHQEEAVAEEEDADDFVFESLEVGQGTTRMGSLSLLLPAPPSPDTPLPVAKGPAESLGECLRKLANMAKVVTYPRVANEWASLKVGELICSIVRRLLGLPSEVWQGEDKRAEGEGGDELLRYEVGGHGGGGGGVGHGHAAAALMVHVCFLLRDRVSNEPKDAAEDVLPILKLFLEMSSNQTAAGVGQGSAASGSAHLSPPTYADVC
jgi:hypothetical protein